METVRHFLKDYGPAVGPALAFVFGFLALFVKYQVDRLTARWSLSRRLRHLEHLVAASGPPETFFPNSSQGFIHADEARNLTNLARFYSRLLALKPVFDSILGPLAESGSRQQIARFHAMKWWFDITLKQVETWRAADRFRMKDSDFRDIQAHWDNLRGAATNPDVQLEYISRRRD
jgi:hypothetical protein